MEKLKLVLSACLLFSVLLIGKEKLAVERGVVAAVDYSPVYGVMTIKTVRYVVRGADIEFEAAQPARNTFKNYPEAVAKVGDTVTFSISSKYAWINGTKMLLNRSSRRPR